MDIWRQAWEASDGSGNAGDADATDRGGRE
jgi:hypothetical protein